MPKKKLAKKISVTKKRKAQVEVKPVLEAKKEVKRNYIFAIGRRKSAVARVRYVKNNNHKIEVNHKDFKEYFPYFEYQKQILEPLEKTSFKDYGEFSIKVGGGGKRGQAEGIRLGIARILLQIDPSWRKVLKVEGLLTRDPRKKERKKFGLKRARRAPQWQKR
ncbi:MAG: 30S ribosomal protein S9 [Patescibacteria group bacterium]